MRKLCAAFVFSLDHGEEVLHLDHAEVLAAAGADRHGAVLLFLLANDEERQWLAAATAPLNG